MVKLLLAVIFYLLGVVSLTANEDLVVRVTPSFCQEPCRIRVFITVNWDLAEGEQICLSLDGAGSQSIATTSCWPYTGVKVREVGIKGIPAGAYTVSVEVRGHYAQAMLEVL